MSPASRSVKPLQGALLLALSALLFAFTGVGIREISVSVNNESVVFFRNLVGVLFFLPLVLVRGVAPMRTTRLKSHLWRTTYGLAAMYCFFTTMVGTLAGLRSADRASLDLVEAYGGGLACSAPLVCLRKITLPAINRGNNASERVGIVRNQSVSMRAHGPCEHKSGWV